MIIENLTLHNFRVFSGTHFFDLKPRRIEGVMKPVILFGGLNGSGKTSILTALKLVLYGRRALGVVSLAEYHNFLNESVHRSISGNASNSSYIEINFQYTDKGISNSYCVKREWEISSNKKIHENINVSCNEKHLQELTYDQAQSFLNELIPVGVSELFFFDGEKIKTLAEETSGDALKESINKLLGLDIVDRLSSDLSVLLRSRLSISNNQKLKDKIANLESEFICIKDSVEQEIEVTKVIKTELAQNILNQQKIQEQIDGRGGAWSLTKQAETEKLIKLTEKKDQLEIAMRDLAASMLPLCLVKDRLGSINESLIKEKDVTKNKFVSDYFQSKRKVLKKNLPNNIDAEAIMSIIDEIYNPNFNSENVIVIYDISESKLASIQYRVGSILPQEAGQCSRMTSEVLEIKNELDKIGENLSRAPDEDILRPLFQSLKNEAEVEITQRVRLKVALDKLKTDTFKMSDIARQLDRLYEDINKSTNDDRAYNNAIKIRNLLGDFSSKLILKKTKEIEQEFISSYKKLARKRDINLSINIDPETFEVVLNDERGMINKNDLSAGEKQIYAISVLEALARASGKSLPVIIDTPLGRLDSHHRRNLVENYFPNASHQVIILSTDTEIDKTYTEILNKNLSHNFHLHFSNVNKSTVSKEGYFEFEMKDDVHVS